jgi:hypothetical protein
MISALKMATQGTFKPTVLDYNIIGLEWKQGTDVYTRLGAAERMDARALDLFYKQIMKGRVNVDDDMNVLARLGDASYIEDGSNGQVMVEIAKFWYKTEDLNSGIYRWWISLCPRSDFKLHPAFIRNGLVNDFVYCSAFEGCAYDVSGGAYNTTDAAGVDFAATTGDKLSSRAGAKPISGWRNTLTIANARQLAKNRGAKWEQLTFNIVSAVQLLYLVEYASFNSQSKIGDGIVSITDDSATNMAINTGATSSLGNASGKVTNVHYQTGQSNFAVSYRGIENFWGNLWIFIDGLSIKADSNPWIADNAFVSDAFSGSYSNTGLTLGNTDGYASNISLSKTWDYMFLPSSVSGGSSTTKLCDYYYQTTGNRIALLGSNWNDGGLAGCFSFVLYLAASISDRTIGARLCGYKR